MRVPAQNQVRPQSGRLGDDVGRMRQQNAKSVVGHFRQSFGGVSATTMRVVRPRNPNPVPKGQCLIAQPVTAATVQQIRHRVSQMVRRFSIALYGEQRRNFRKVTEEGFGGRKGSVPHGYIARQGNQVGSPLSHQCHRLSLPCPEATHMKVAEVGDAKVIVRRWESVA
jgi:hypothetical protein